MAISAVFVSSKNTYMSILEEPFLFSLFSCVFLKEEEMLLLLIISSRFNFFCALAFQYSKFQVHCFVLCMFHGHHASMYAAMPRLWCHEEMFVI